MFDSKDNGSNNVTIDASSDNNWKTQEETCFQMKSSLTLTLTPLFSQENEKGRKIGTCPLKYRLKDQNWYNLGTVTAYAQCTYTTHD